MRLFSILCVAFSVFPAIVFGGGIDYSKVAEATSSRVDGVLVRYLRLYGDVCVSVQIIDSKSWGVVEERKICEIDGLSFYSDFADAHFSSPEFSGNGLSIELSVTPLAPIGEQKKKCFVSIHKNSIGSMVCTDI